MDGEGAPFATETYGSQEKWRYRLTEGRVVVREKSEAGGRSSLLGLFKSVFLPQGYPDSVSKDYLQYQFWDTVQAFSSSLSGNLSTQASLRGVGVGNQEATVAAATVTWLLRDGTGMLGRILFAWIKGSKLDCDAKKWRLVADVLNDVAMFMEILAPSFPACFTLIVCIAGVFKETLVNLAGLLVSLVLIPLVTDNPLLTFTLFFFFTVLHLLANYRAVRSVVMETLNETRLSILLHHYLSDDQILSPLEANHREPVFPDFKRRVPIKLGVRLGELVNSPAELQLALKNNRKPYLIGVKDGSVCVCRRQDMPASQEIKAVCQAVCLSTALLPGPAPEGVLKTLCAVGRQGLWEMVSESHKLIENIFPSFLDGLRAHGWQTDRLLLDWDEWRVDWGKKSD
ncbi:RUS family member 1 isoform X2 [Scleropages formosus]|uniref:RUS family member 1 n=1 Tax=Scleropages formosus TaxID=113540 RepID=A0A8C9V0X4_SCLFO|nr:RUS1 family protein C16orf58 homolog isoform X2 [Scleropages formosus]